MLYHNDYTYYPKRNTVIEQFVVSIIPIVTGIYDSHWRVFKRPHLPAIARFYSDFIKAQVIIESISSRTCQYTIRQILLYNKSINITKRLLISIK